MTSMRKEPLFILIKSLSKSEKRQFRLYVGRLGINTDAKFIGLFNLMEKLSKYDEQAILESGIVKKQQLSNLKAHLYRQILISLRMSPLNQNIRIQIREQLDFATILYHKGLYRQSLKILDKAKSIAIPNEEKNIAYEIVELEKVIETQYITRSISSRAEKLEAEAKKLSANNVLASQLSNLSLQLYGKILKSGYVRSDEEFKEISTYFYNHLPIVELTTLEFREKRLYYQANLWYSFLSQDFLGCFKYAKKWVSLFYQNKKMIYLNPVSFLKGNQYLLESLFYVKYSTEFRKAMSQLEEVVHQDLFPKNDNLKTLIFINLNLHKLNLHLLEGTFEEGLYLVPIVLEGIQREKIRIDEHHIMIFYYKMACLYFGKGDNKSCIHYLKLIIDNKNLVMREDLMCFARVLSLVAHYELGLDYHLETQLKSTYRFLMKMNDLHAVQREMIKFLRNLGNIYPHELKKAFIALYKELKRYETHPYEKRAFLYLDILSWLESKIQGQPVGKIIREKSRELLR